MNVDLDIMHAKENFSPQWCHGFRIVIMLNKKLNNNKVGSFVSRLQLSRQNRPRIAQVPNGEFGLQRKYCF